MQTSSVAAPLLATKLYLPLPRTTAIARSRLVARLQAGLRSRITLLAAPAGFGKSTLLAQALARAHFDQGVNGTKQTIASVALDAGDNDPTRFWSYVCTALERASPGIGAPSVALLRTSPAAVEPVLAELLNTLAEHPEHIVLVLDDYHTITNQAIHEGIGFLLDYAPPQFHLVIASRVDPPLPLARWRARGELVEIRAADLRFTSNEAVHFFAETMGLQLDEEAAAALETRTEGWAAGLQLAALSLQGQTDVRSFIASFSGSHRHVVDYLLEEVLNRQPDHIRTFLLQTSVLERMSAELCDEVLQKDERSHSSSFILEELDRQNLFLIPLDQERRWYRYHHLFADLLRHRLRHEYPTLVQELHRRAAYWFEQQGAVTDAIQHALASADSELAVRLVTAYASRFTANGEGLTVQTWLDALPRAQLLNSPRLCLAQAWVLMLNRQVSAIEQYLGAAETLLSTADELNVIGLRGELLALRAQAAIERGAFADALKLAQEALRLLPETETWARSCNALALGYALMVLGKTGDAIAVHAENVKISRAAGNAVSGLFSATEVVKLRMLQGRLTYARTSGEQSLAWAETERWQHLPPASALHIWLGNVLIEQGDFHAADAQLARAIELTRHGPGITSARAHTFLARLRVITGDEEGTNAALATVDEICRDWDPKGERTFFRAYTARVRLLQGDMAAARSWASEQTPWNADETPSYFREIDLLTLARIAVFDHTSSKARLQETLDLLKKLRDDAKTAGRGAVVIETLALQAVALNQSGAATQAHDLLNEALACAAPEGVVGTFADFGRSIADLLAQNLNRRSANDPLRPYLKRILHILGGCKAEQAAPAPVERPARQASPDTEALTERELEVLRLFAAGMTSPEIAQHFVVSINTVKTQLKSIYSKLDTHSRAELVARARDMGLIR